MVMPAERISGLEAKVDEQARGIGELRESIRNLDAKVDRHFGLLDQKISSQFGTLDQKASRQFLWLAGFQLTTLLAIIGFLSR